MLNLISNLVNVQQGNDGFLFYHSGIQTAKFNIRDYALCWLKCSDINILKFLLFGNLKIFVQESENIHTNYILGIKN